MSVYEALLIIIKIVENQANCGRLSEDGRKAKIILYNYVVQKLAEEEVTDEETE